MRVKDLKGLLFGIREDALVYRTDRGLGITDPDKECGIFIVIPEAEVKQYGSTEETSQTH